LFQPVRTSHTDRLVLQQGFAGTSIEQILEEAQITKGGFFYHFDGKNDLARHLILRHLEEDEAFFLDLVSKAQALSEDPLQQFLIFLKLLAEAMGNLPEMHPGCLVASFTYESQQFNEDVHELNAKGILSWRKIFEEQLDRIPLWHRSRVAGLRPGGQRVQVGRPWHR